MTLETYFDELTHRDWQESSTADGPIRMACIGAGFWGENEALPAMAASDLCEPTVVVDADESRAIRVAQERGLEGLRPEQFTDGQASDEYDAIYVATPNATHLEYVETAAELGKDILCEKPMERSSDRAQEMIETVSAAGITLMIGYRMQTDPIVRRAKDLLKDGVVGEPIHVHGHMSDPLLEMIPDPDQWRLDPELAGGCSMIDIGVYSANTTRFLLDADPVSVQARTVSEHEAFADVDEHVAFTLEFPDGVLASCSASHNATQASHLKIVGTDGEVTLEPIFFPWETRTLTVRRGGHVGEITFDEVSQMVEEFDYFADCLLADRDPVPDGEHGLVDVEIVEAAYENAATEATTIRK